jgi:iron(III) transport system substrate-binding protein
MDRRLTTRATAAVLLLVIAAAACGGAEETPAAATREITVYSGRSEKLVGPLIERFQKETGTTVRVRYGDTAELAAQILEEGDNSPADVFFAQDAGALGALQEKGRFASLPQSILTRVPGAFRSKEGRWVGTSGRVRVAAYNPTLVKESELPGSILDFTGRRWRGRIGWAPTNGSFQVFVTAMRVLKGDDVARRWLEGVKANGAKVYPNNDAIAEAVSEGEIEVGFVNHYYPFEIREEIPNAKVEDHFFENGDPGGLINVAGCGILASSKNKETAGRLIAFLLSDEGQRYFVEKTFEYPLVPGLAPDPRLPAFESLEAPAVDLSGLSDLEGTLDLLKEVGLL